MEGEKHSGRKRSYMQDESTKVLSKPYSEVKFGCSICHASFSQIDELKIHFQLEHNQRKDNGMEGSKIKTSPVKKARITVADYNCTTLQQDYLPDEPKTVSTPVTTLEQSVALKVTKTQCDGLNKAPSQTCSLLHSRTTHKEGYVVKKMREGKIEKEHNSIKAKETDSSGQNINSDQKQNITTKCRVILHPRNSNPLKLSKEMKTKADEEAEKAYEELKFTIKKLETMGKDIVLILKDGDRCRCFGSTFGLKFATENPNSVLTFFNFCKDKRRALDALEALKKSLPEVHVRITQEPHIQKLAQNLQTNSSKTKQIKKDISCNTLKVNGEHDLAQKNNKNENIWDSSEINDDDLNDYFDDTYTDDFVGNDVSGFIGVNKNIMPKENLKNVITVREKPVHGGHGTKIGVANKMKTELKHITIDKGTTDCVKNQALVEECNKNVSDEMKAKEVQTKTDNEEELRREKHMSTIIKDLEAFDNENKIDLDKVSKLIKTFPSGLDWRVKDLNKGKIKCSKCDYKFLWKCHLHTHQVKMPYCNKDDYEITVTQNDIMKESITFKDSKTDVEITATIQNLVEAQKRIPLVCDICGYTTDVLLNIRRHILGHNTNKIFKCNICAMGFVSSVHLSSHLKAHFRTPYECDLCPIRFKKEKTLESHTKVCCRNVSLLRTDFDTERNLENSKRSMTRKIVPKPIPCKRCGKQFITTTKLNIHMVDIHAEYCGYPISKSEDGKPICPLCQKVCDNIWRLNGHFISHGERKYLCKHCNKGFKDQHGLRTHEQRHENYRPFMCDFCGRKYQNNYMMEVHRRSHTGETPFKCQVLGCTKAFQSREGLKQHKYYHSESKDFICDVCGRCFKNPNQLRYHHKNHTVEYRWPCAYCVEKFKSLWIFKRHLAQNHAEKRKEIEANWHIKLHSCPYCPRLYGEIDDLNSHINTHQGLKPHVCKLCGKSFSDSSNLRSHHKIHMGDKILKCCICSRKFIKDEFLKSHMERVHNAEQVTYACHQDSQYDVRTMSVLDKESIEDVLETTPHFMDDAIDSSSIFNIN